MNILRACLNWRVVAAIAAVGVGVAVFAPDVIAAAVPLLLVAACPLSMLVMMRTMGGRQSDLSPGPDPGVVDRPAQLREQLAARRLEQEQLEQELARLEAADRVPTTEGPGTAPVADIQARLS
ncbi:MAG TPA: DUF2933 domain-containing protein [Patescibacteria group bacterium]|nr:DUF2933 domain-containing protein [Patescibacteria group bacterium]